MRPLRLRMSGLRSYVREQVIDFTDARLVAIVGDTGAGKSSILEAICFALYGAATWNAREVKDLISDRADTVRVQFEFLADGQRWQATRATSTKAYPPPVHELRCLDDPAVRIDGAAEVTRQVERLIGLDYRAFLRAVVLPQGRFQELLQAAPGERTGILKGIFRLDVLEAMREVSDRLHRENAGHIHQLEVEQASLLENPPEILRTRGADAELAQSMVRRLEGIRDEVQKLRAGATEHLQASERLAHAAERMGEALSQGIADSLRGVVERALPLLEAGETLQRETKDAEREETRLRDRWERLESEDRGERALARWEQELKHLHELVVESALQDDRLAERKKEIARRKVQVEKETKALATKERALKRLEGELADLRESRRAAEETLLLARQGLERVRERNEQKKAAALALEHTSEEIQRVEAVVRIAQSAVDEQTARLEMARNEQRALVRQHAAAHAGADCVPGDPCPVCDRKLPKGFRPPAIPASSVEETIAKIEVELTRAQAAFTTAETTLTHLRKQRMDLDGKHRDAESGATEAENRLRAILPNPSLDLGDETVLSRIADQHPVGTREAEVAKSRTAYDEAKEVLAQTKASLSALQDATTLEHGTWERSWEAGRTRWTDLASALLDENPSPSLTEESLERARTSWKRAAASFEKLRGQVRTAHDRVKTLREQEAKNRDRLDRDLARPLQGLQSSLNVLLDRLEQARKLHRDAATSLDAADDSSPLPDPPRLDPRTMGHPQALLAWAEDLEEVGRKHLIALEETAT
ncbi:MAG: SMC family ATPase, partial [Candidatus Eisenbacteria bacterium]|nr:SMC family ATPase [Candidatus Eisenbacteria bacterium]